ncbi:srp40-suppressor of mutant ac40 of rna polymerase i and iii [Fusarium sporotrichioides]|uniref:Srp40-suppressor of mutant ac40 of rna polymerase i and iii n=1 Tax=Fusarium sporotrichioides TaxID=5514 RepID=A0A395SVX3_FUSSP|nr:srp40-suppressor of mutant ac40 of rna polymerase i and iii [Fusarium sporotrichioides]
MPPRNSTPKSKLVPQTSMRQTRARSKLSNATPLMQGLDHRGRPQGPLIENPKAPAKGKVVQKPDNGPKSALKKAHNQQRRKKKVAVRAQRSHSETPPSSPPAKSPSPTAEQTVAKEASTLLTPANSSDDAGQQRENSPAEGDVEDSPDADGSGNDAGDADDALPVQNDDNHAPDEDDAELSDDSDSHASGPSEPIAHCKVLTPISVLMDTDSSGSSSPSSGSFSPLIMPRPDPEIPVFFGSGVRARPHYGWYEQYHHAGRDCAKVHGCTHNPGRVCHSCHADWQKAWSVYFKAHELLDEAAANPEEYLAETGVDVRQDYLGHLLEGSGWEVLALELQPPVGNSIRLHPTRIAKYRLAFAQMAADM